MSPPIPKRAEIWLANFDPILGRELKKTRPCVIIQNDLGNQHSPTTIVAPIISTKYISKIVVEVIPTPQNGLNNTSYINCAQIRCIDKQRLIKRLGLISTDILQKTDEALKASLSL